MSILHVSDLHLGRTLGGYSLEEDQEFILKQIIKCVEDHQVRFLVIAGDIYDHSMPSSRAIKLFEDFLLRLSCITNLDTLIVSGNHDDATRTGYASFALSRMGIHLVTDVTGARTPIVFDAERIAFTMLPYLYSEDFSYLSREKGMSAEEGYRVLIEENLKGVPQGYKRIAICHQFVAGFEPSASERSSALIADTRLPLSLFTPFDLTLLGHLHKTQAFREQKIYYCGAPLIYSVKEIGNTPRMLLFSDDLALSEEIPFTPLHPVTRVQGTFEECMAEEIVARHQQDYVHVMLEGDAIPTNAERQLKNAYPLFIRADRDRVISDGLKLDSTIAMPKDKLELFKAFYKKIIGNDITPEEEEIVLKALSKSEEESL